MVLEQVVQETQVFCLVMLEQVANASFAVKQSLLVLEQHLCFELLHQGLLDVVPGQIPFRSSDLFSVKLARLVKIF